MIQDLSQLDRRVSEILSCAWAPNTLSCRISQWKKYLKFCADRNLSALPAELTTTVRFMAYLESLGYAYVTINNYLSGVIVLLKFYGVDQSFRDSYLIQTMLAGLKRRVGVRSTPKLPLSIKQLSQIYWLYPRFPLNNACWLAIIICFHTLLRKSNVVYDKENVHVLLRSDVVFFPIRVVFNIRTSKTRNKGEEILEIPVVVSNNFAFCVYNQLKLHILRYPAPISSPLLVRESSKGLVPLMYRDVLKFLKNCVILLGIAADRVGLHFLRRSGAMFLQMAGIPLYEIQLLGDWKSMVVMLYLASTLDRKLQTQQLVVDRLNHI